MKKDDTPHMCIKFCVTPGKTVTEIYDIWLLKRKQSAELTTLHFKVQKQNDFCCKESEWNPSFMKKNT
jgi:hypothetical protein